MFEQATLSNGPAAKRVWTTCLGITGQALVVTGMTLTPLIWPEVLPKVEAFMPVTFRPVPPPPPPEGPVKPSGPVRIIRDAFRLPVLTAPRIVPSSVLSIDDAPEVVGSGVVAGVPGGQKDGVPGGIPQSILNRMTLLPPPPPSIATSAKIEKPETITRVVRTTQLDRARIIHRVDPLYPQMAIQMRISGTVELRGVIGTDGRIRELKVLRGHPLLVKAAVDAVRQWIYEPTRLNGQTVEVDAPILVTFHLRSQ